MQKKKYNYKFNVVLLFLFLSSLTIASHSFGLNMANWIDIPTHFVGGMVVAIFLSKETFKKKPLLSIFIIAAIGFGWEFVEITVAKKEILTALFQETKVDKVGDLIVGLAGFVFAYGKKNSPLKKHTPSPSQEGNNKKYTPTSL